MRNLIAITMLLASAASAQHYIIINDTDARTQTLLSGCEVTHTFSVARPGEIGSSGTCTSARDFPLVQGLPNHWRKMPDALYGYGVDDQIISPAAQLDCRVGLLWSGSVNGSRSLLSVWCVRTRWARQ